MKVLLFFMLLLTGFVSQGQTMDWKKYIPAQPVDSIVFLSTNKGGPRQLTAKDSASLSAKEMEQIALSNKKITEAFHDKVFPLNNYATYLEVYEIKKRMTGQKGILSTLELFPNTTCTEIPSGCRCLPDFRDCVIFFYQSKPVYALKICFECEEIYSTPDTHEAKCLGEREQLTIIRTDWIKKGLIDLYERK
ncbi:MAG: hypothetical protein K0R51_836 [Cytophagaceae bacterium]|jgi:hypothetical protein|nr:hypothetical protein [Cytophagaceae bacterium]